jgi:hypothetical protein
MVRFKVDRGVPTLEDLCNLHLSAEEAQVFDGSALDYLQGVYQGRLRFEPHRFRAANAALPFESPKLAVAAVIHPDGDIAARLERAIARANGGSLRPAVQVIEHAPSELVPERQSADERRRFIPRRRLAK